MSKYEPLQGKDIVWITCKECDKHELLCECESDFDYVAFLDASSLNKHRKENDK